MNPTELQKTLESLRAELKQATSVDHETRSLLTALEEDIERLSDPNGAESASELEPLSERVQDMILRFETEHPQLTTVLNQVAAALANLGI